MTLTTLPDGSDEPIEVFDAEIPAQNLLTATGEDTDASDDALAAVRFAFVAPQFLVPNSINRTFTDEELADLMASVPVVGFLQAAVVVPTDPPPSTEAGSQLGTDGAQFYRVLIGNRRREVADRLGRPLPCLIISGGDSVQEILAILSENDDRLALKPSEKADLYRQLTLMDWTPAKIAKARGVKTAEIRQALSLAAMPDAVRAAADSGQLPLALAPDLAQLDDDPQALAKVLEKGNKWGFRHAVNDAVERKARKQAADRLFAELVTAGVTVVPKPAGFDDLSIKATAVSRLVDADGNPVEEAAVRTKPGFAAFINKSGYGEPTAVVFCTDPERHGYTRDGFSRYVPDAEKAAREAALAAAEALRAGLKAAAVVRREFLVSHYGNARRAKAAQTDVLRAAIADPWALIYRAEYLELADAVAGVRIAEAVETAGADRLARMLVARWVSASEQNLDAVIDRRIGGKDEPAAVAYLERLVSAGYELAAAEQQLLADITARLNPADDDAYEDDIDEEDRHSSDPVSELEGGASIVEAPAEHESPDDTADGSSDEVTPIGDEQTGPAGIGSDTDQGDTDQGVGGQEPSARPVSEPKAAATGTFDASDQDDAEAA